MARQIMNANTVVLCSGMKKEKKSVHTKVTYSSCCKEGKIKLPPFNNPPEIYNRYSLIYTMFKYFWLQNDQIIVL